jgi:hypothetical protein
LLAAFVLAAEAEDRAMPPAKNAASKRTREPTMSNNVLADGFHIDRVSFLNERSFSNKAFLRLPQEERYQSQLKFHGAFAEDSLNILAIQRFSSQSRQKRDNSNV